MKNKDIMLVLVSAFVLAFAWIIFNIIHNGATSTISETLNSNIAPIDPNFDTKTIDELKKRQVVNPLYSVSNQVISAPVQGQGTSSPSANLSNTEQATKGGSISL